MSEPLLVAKDLRKSFVSKRSLLGRPTVSQVAVDSVSFELHAGETVAVVGESGAGKSTVGRMVVNLVEPDGGTVAVEGTEMRSLRGERLRRARARVRMIFQDPFSSLDPTMTIEQTLAEVLGVHEIGAPRERRDRVADLLQRVGLPPAHMSRFPYEFSGGQLQRVAVARAIATTPALIVCDEPVAALDTSIRAQVINLLQDLQDQSKLGYLFITHDLSLVRYLADRVIVMYRGVVVESGSTRQIFEDPQDAYTQNLLRAIPSIVPGQRRPSRANAAPPTTDCRG